MYNILKYTVANTIANQFSFLGSDIQSYIRTAVVALIDYGLASVGLPPSLPNFEKLFDQGLDYCVQVALRPHESTFIRVFLKPDHTDLPIWKDYYRAGLSPIIMTAIRSSNTPRLHRHLSRPMINEYFNTIDSI